MGSSLLPSLISLEGPALRNLDCSSSAQQSSFVSSAATLVRLSGPRLTVRQARKTRQHACCARFSAGDSQDEMMTRTLQSGSGGKLKSDFHTLQSEDGIIEEEERAGARRRGQDSGGDPSSSSESSFTLFSVAPMLVYPLIAEGTGYSQASYYTSLGLFVISVPGIWSLVKRSIKSKIVKKTFALPGPNEAEGKRASQIAGEITSSLARSNFAVADRGETVTFEGTMLPSRGQAAFLSFCTAVSLGSVALVLSITAPDIGQNWYYLPILSPLAGFYYWTRASRKEQIKVKMVVADDESSTDVIIQGDDEQIDRLRRELGLMEKGMVYVKGLLER